MRLSHNLLLTTLVALLALPAAAASVSDLMVHGAWAAPTLPGQTTGVAYVNLHNAQDAPVTLTGLQSPEAKRAEFHTHTMDAHGVMRMEKQPSLTIPAGDMAQMQPGGLHIMLFDLRAPLKEGDTLHLLFSDGSAQLPVDVPVENRRAEGHGAHPMGDKPGDKPHHAH
jgi:copper(I)-binding protein